MFDDVACSIGFDLSGSQRHEGLCLQVHGGGGGGVGRGEDLCHDQLRNWHVRLPFLVRISTIVS